MRGEREINCDPKSEKNQVQAETALTKNTMFKNRNGDTRRKSVALASQSELFNSVIMGALQVLDPSIIFLELRSQGLAWLNLVSLQYINKVILSLNLEAPPQLLMASLEPSLRVQGVVERGPSESTNS